MKGKIIFKHSDIEAIKCLFHTLRAFRITKASPPRTIIYNYLERQGQCKRETVTESK